MPKQNSQQIYCKMVKNTDLYTVNAGAYTIAQAQTAYDAYIDAGYDQFDASTNHSLDVSGEAGDKIVIIWKSATAFVGEYQLRASYFAGKTVVIFAVKLDGSDNVTAVGLRVNFNSFEAGQVDLNALTFEGTDQFYFYRQYTKFNLTGISFKKCTCYWRRAAVLDVTSFDQVKFYTRDSMTITCNQTSGLFDMEKEPVGIAGSESSLTITGMAANSFVKVGKYAYIGNNTTGYLRKVDLDTMTDVGGLDLSNTHMYLATDGKTIYVSDTTGRYVQKVLIVDFTLVGSTVDLGAGAVGGPGVCDGLKVYFADSGTAKMWRIVISSSAVSSVALNQPTYSNVVINGTYIVCGSGLLDGTYDKILLSTFVASNVISAFPKANDPIAIDETYVFYLDQSDGVCKVQLSDNTKTQISLVCGNVVLSLNNKLVASYGNAVYTYDTSTLVSALVFTLSFTISNPALYDGKYLYCLNGTSFVRINYQYGVDLFEGFRALTMPDPAIIMANDYIKLELSKLRTRYFKPENSNVDQVRDYMVEEYDPEKEVNDLLKVFCGGYTKVIHRVAVTEGGITENDLDGVLCVSSSEKKIIEKKLYDNDGVTPYTFSALPHDENFLMLVTDPDGNYYVFSWYNDEIRDTWYSVTDDTVEYTIRRCFQLATRYGTEFDIANLENKVNSPLEASIVWNLQDNENIRK